MNKCGHCGNEECYHIINSDIIVKVNCCICGHKTKNTACEACAYVIGMSTYV